MWGICCTICASIGRRLRRCCKKQGSAAGRQIKATMQFFILYISTITEFVLVIRRKIAELLSRMLFTAPLPPRPAAALT